MIWDPTETTPGREIRFYSREHQEANYRLLINVLCAPGSCGWNGGGSTGGGGGGGGGEGSLRIDGENVFISPSKK